MKAAKQRARLGIRWKLIAYFAVFVVVILALLWLFQTVFLDSFYQSIKTQNAKSCGDSIVSSLNSADVGTYIADTAQQNDICVRVLNDQFQDLYSADVSPDCLIHHYGPLQLFLIYNSTKENGGMIFETVSQAQYQSFYNGGKNQLQEINGQKPDFGNIQPQQQVVQNDRGMDSIIYSRLVTLDTGRQVLVLLNSTITPVNPTVETIRIQLIIITAVALLLSLVLAVVLSKKLSKPIIKTNTTARELARGNYGVTFEGGDYQEILELNSTLNYAATELSKVESLRKELIANVSHDLRTPLTMIAGYSEMMRDIPGENSPENVQIIIDETTRLSNLVNDMLNLSKLQSGTQTLNKTEFSLTAQIRETLNRYNTLTKRDGYAISFDYREEVVVEADEVRISQVLYNLINNAVNYTGKDKAILIRQRLKPGYVRIEVIDHGEGIDPEKLDYIWDRYYKVDKTHRRAVIGTGLGLSIVKSALEMHDANYGVESEPGKGSNFWFELPLPEYLAEIDKSNEE